MMTVSCTCCSWIAMFAEFDSDAQELIDSHRGEAHPEMDEVMFEMRTDDFASREEKEVAILERWYELEDPRR